jgi:hypothetical protein
MANGSVLEVMVFKADLVTTSSSCVFDVSAITAEGTTILLAE